MISLKHERMKRRPRKINEERLNYIRDIITKNLESFELGMKHHTAFLNTNIILGKNITIGPLACIGWYGIGMEWDEEGQVVRFPQFGKVKIGDDVFICAGAHIDASTNDERYTEIGDRCIIGPKAHLCHNVQIGNDSVVLGDAIICGSAIIGERCLIGANATIRNKVKIGNDVIVGMGAVVTKDVPDKAIVKGIAATWEIYE